MASALQAKDIFLRALEKESAKERQQYVAAACGDDTDLLRRVDALLAAHDQPESYVDRPAIQRISDSGAKTDV